MLSQFADPLFKFLNSSLVDINFVHGKKRGCKQKKTDEREQLELLYKEVRNIRESKQGEEKLADIKPKFKSVYDTIVDLNSKLIALENKLEELKLPSTPGRLPKWNGQ